MAIDPNNSKYKNSSIPTVGKMFYFFDKADEYNKNFIEKHYVKKQEGMNLISDTTLASITSYLADDGSDTTIAEINKYFADKNALLVGISNDTVSN